MPRPTVSRSLLAVSLALACGCSATSTNSAAVHTGTSANTLETALARTQPSTAAPNTLRRTTLLAALGRADQAHAELEASIRAARERVDWRAMSALWRARGRLHLEGGDAERALSAFGNRLQISTSLEDELSRATALVDTAYAFLLLGRIGQADAAVAEARVLGGQRLEADPESLERLGLIAAALGDSDGAIRRLTKAARRYGDPADVARVTVLAVRASDADAAKLAEYQPVAGRTPDPGPRALLAMFIAEAHLVSGDHDACEKSAREAVALGDARGLLRVSKLSRVVAARCAEKAGRARQAIPLAQDAAAIVEDQIGKVRGALARQELGFEAFQIYRLLVELELRVRDEGYVDRAFLLSERARGRAHLDAIVAAKVARFSSTLPISPALSRDRADAENRVRRLTDALVATRADKRVAKRHRDALWALEEINESIRGDNPLLARVAPPVPASLAKVRGRLLDDKTAMLSYFVAGDRVLLFAVNSDTASLSIVAEQANKLDREVRAYRDDFLLDPDSELDEVREAGGALYNQLIAPAKKVLAGRTKLLVVPHGQLSSLPFESLVSGRKFVVEKYDVRYSASATLALALRRPRRRRAEPTRSFVGIGDPVYDWEAFRAGGTEKPMAAATRGFDMWTRASSSAAGKKRLGLDRIPGTARELRMIKKMFGKRAKIYLRDRATEETVKAGALSDARIVHIASHGLMAAHYQALALTLDPKSPDDGFLMSSEIATLELSADLVVLSACRTGNTRSRAAEPVAGMALALRSAGAKSAVLSLWDVDDAATADLMHKFYSPLAADSSEYGRGLAQAKRAMIKGDYNHPFFWAAFVLHGE